jgi:hypothetical protein
VVPEVNWSAESSVIGACEAFSSCTPTPAAVPFEPSTDATPEVPVAELNVIETFTPESQLRAIENGFSPATAPALGNDEIPKDAKGMF